MLKILSLIIGFMFSITAIFLLFFTYKNLELTIYDDKKVHKHRVVLIILDAFRHDYLEFAKSNNIALPNLNKMAAIGARSMKEVPVFPSVTMTNHQTLVTGLYSPYHGIVGNTFNDTSLNNNQFAMGNQSALNEARWYDGYPEPIWVTCERSAHCKSGSMLYPNTDASISGYRPYRYVGQYTPLNEPTGIYPYERRVDELIGWMKKDLIDFGLLYFDEPDATSHKNGPFHHETMKKLQEIDGYIGRFIDGLKKCDLLTSTDLILTGDHGMTELSEERVIEIDKFVPSELYQSLYSYPVGIIYPNEGKFDEVFTSYSKASEHIKVYKRQDVPVHLHFSDNSRRISPIVTVVELGWFVKSSHWIDHVKKGSHGYDPNYDDMKTTLLAMGPSFRRVTINTTNHVDVYSLLSHLLGLVANPHNGSFDRIAPILTAEALHWTPVEDKWVYNRTVMVVYLALCFQVVASVVFVVAMSLYSRRHQAIARIVARYDPEQCEALITSD